MMRLPVSLHVAWRYLLSRSSHSVVNTISWVSVLAVAMPVVAMVVILSLHNGLSRYIEDLYGDFDSSAQITQRSGGYFAQDSLTIDAILKIDGVTGVSQVVEQNVLLVGPSGSYQVATLRGVDSNYVNVIPLEARIEYGSFNLDTAYCYNALLGRGVVYNLGLHTAVEVNGGGGQLIDVYALPPRSEVRSLFDMGGYNNAELRPTGIYGLDEQTDARYVFANLAFCQSLFGAQGMITSLEVGVDSLADFDDIRLQLDDVARSHDLVVRSRFEQKETMYRVVAIEKLMIYALLILVLLIASMSLVGQTLMSVVEKRRDVLSLRAVGGTSGFVRRVFFYQGMLIVGIGSMLGVVIGISLVYLQYRYGFITMAGESFAMNAYPVELRWTDVVGVLATVAALGGVLLWGVVRMVIKEKNSF